MDLKELEKRFEVLAVQHDKALAENKRYKQALEFYANQTNYEVDVINQWEPVRPVLKDNGEKAREVLGKS